jgi:hypothetical protein|tara:strand:- start:1070 stop:2302 length:1233 start_codon:yes stop_codon:yes gene_type:complete
MSETIDKKIHFEVSTIETIDKSVLNFVESLGLSTMTNKGFKPVPIIWGTAERAYQVKKNKEIRDSQGLLVLPIISIKRAGFVKNSASPGVFQGNVPEVDDAQGGSLSVSRTIYQQKTLKFANADALKLYGQKNYPAANPKVVYRTVTVPMPVNVEVSYEITLRTEYQQQMNDLMTPFVTTPGTVNFVRLVEKDHRYEGFIQSDYSSADNLSDFSGDERKFETKINLKVIGYIVGEGPNREKPHYAIRENAVEIKIPRERITLGEIPDHEYGAYYGLEGVPPEVLEQLLMSPYTINNVPAASFFNTTAGSGGGSSDTSANVVTTETFAKTMAENLVVREILKEEGANPGDLRNFTTRFTIRANTEQVTVNGQLQPHGALDPGTYTISGGNTVVFNENVETGDFVVITYIKG